MVALYGQIQGLDARLARRPADLHASAARARAGTELERLRRRLGLNAEADHSTRRQARIERAREDRMASEPDSPLSMLDGAYQDEQGQWWSADGLLALAEPDAARRLLIDNAPAQRPGRRARDPLDAPDGP